MTLKYLKILTLFALLIITGSIKMAWSGDIYSKEYDIKAAYIYNFANFVKWPNKVFESEDSPIILVILGKNPFQDATDTINGKDVRGRKLLISSITTIDKIDKCHILFISSSEKDHLQDILSKIAKKALLTIGDTKHFGYQGVMINMFKCDDRIKYEINLKAAKVSKIKISSQLLKMAKIVESKHGLEN